MKGDFMWAVAQMKEGKKVRRKDWCNSFYWDEEILLDVESPPDSRRLTNILNHFEATDWEIYEEKKEKVDILFGMDIVTDTRIPKGTMALGEKNADGTITVKEFIKFPEEKQSLSDDVRDYARNNVVIRAVPEYRVKQFIEDLHKILDEDGPFSKLGFRERLDELAGERLV